MRKLKRGKATAPVPAGLGVVAVGVWAWAYYRFSYVAIEPTEVVQRTATNRIKRKAPRHGRPGKTSNESKDRRRGRQRRK